MKDIELKSGKKWPVNTAYFGDALDFMKELPERIIDLTVTSPPYDNLRSYEGSLKWDESVWKNILEQLFRITKIGGVVVWVVGDATVNGSETGTSFKQALYAIECGFKLHDTMIWNKNQFSVPNKNRYHQTFEYMFIFSKGNLKTFNPIKDKKNKYFGKVRDGNIRKPDGEITKRSIKTVSEYGKRYNVWNIPAETHLGIDVKHPAIFPEELARDHILSWSNPEDIVFDPFAGSFTTLKMAHIENRKWIACEGVEKYFEIGTKRYQDSILQKRFDFL